MLTDQERGNVVEFLEHVPIGDIYSIASVVTNKAVKLNSKEDAVNSILLHESSYWSLLNRKKITKSVLFSYLHSKNVSFAGTLDKGGLVNITIQLWTEKSMNKVVVTGDNISRQPDSVNIESELAKLFTCWFYGKLNADFMKEGGEVVVEADFWPDCHACIHLPDTCPEDGVQTYLSEGPSQAVQLIRGLRHQYDLYFSPNIHLDGVKGRSDPHGLILVAVCGTVHSRAGQCVGLFEQVFALIADPMAGNNYKIKRTKLVLRKGSSVEPAISLYD